MSDVARKKPEKSIDQGKEKTVLSTTPMVLSFFVERGNGSREGVTKFIFEVANELRDSDIRIDAVFRGDLAIPDKGRVESETIDDELSFWLSNGILRECSKAGEDARLFCIDSSFKREFETYKVCTLTNTMRGVRWRSDNQKELLTKTVKHAMAVSR